MSDIQILDAYFQQAQLRYLQHKVRIVDLDYPDGKLVSFVRPLDWPLCASITVQDEQKEQLRETFDYIYNPDGSCTTRDCGNQGVVLAYDGLSPEFAHWFCEECWADAEKEGVGELLEIVQDNRKETAS